MDIMAGVVPVPCTTPPGHRQHADLLIVANGFCRDAGSARELANRQRSFHGRSSLCDVSGKKGTRSTGWKVKGVTGQTEKFFTRASNVSCLPDQRQLVATMGMGAGMTRYIVAS